MTPPGPPNIRGNALNPRPITEPLLAAQEPAPVARLVQTNRYQSRSPLARSAKSWPSELPSTVVNCCHALPITTPDPPLAQVAAPLLQPVWLYQTIAPSA